MMQEAPYESAPSVAARFELAKGGDLDGEGNLLIDPMASRSSDYNRLSAKVRCGGEEWSGWRRQLAGVAIIALCVTLGVVLSKSSEPKRRNRSHPCTSPLAVKNLKYLHRLPKWHIPSKYSVFWGFAPGFEGQAPSAVDIVFRPAGKRTVCNWVWLNSEASRVIIDRVAASVQTQGSEGVPAVSVAKVVHHPELPLLGVQLPQSIMKQLSNEFGLALVLHINFRMEVSSQHLEGIYSSSWSQDGVARTIVSSQFEATAARKAFPCFDEPAYKANFSVVLGCTECSSMAMLSNMPTQGTQPGSPWAAATSSSIALFRSTPGSRITSFQPTLPMSTYLLAITIGDLEARSRTISYQGKPTTVSVWTTIGSRDLGSYALEAGAGVLEYYQSYFGIGFPLPKCDMVAIPNFAAGAMENWGLVLYRETALLVNESLSSDQDRERVAVVVAHELAHQWFGNLVSMKWWNDLWLNEGFASFTEFLGTNHIDPSFKIWNQFLNSDVIPALEIDGLRTASHMLHQPESVVQTPGEIEELFDTIDYEKGASVVSMVSKYVDRVHGANAWRASIRSYLNEHAFGNAQASDLWNAVATYTNDPRVVDRFNTWTLQEGYPLVVVGAAAATQRTLTQTQFFNYKLTDEFISHRSWWLPITYTICEKDSDACVAVRSLNFDSIDSSIKLVQVENGADHCLKVNVDQEGFYRVTYDVANWQCLAHRFLRFSNNDRAGLIDDVFSIAYIGRAPYTVAKEFADKAKHDLSLSTWKPLLSHLLSIQRKVAGQSQTCQDNVKQYIQGIVGPAADQLGLIAQPGDDHSTILLRSLISRVAVLVGHQATIDAARSMYSSLSPSKISPDIQNTIFRAVVMYGDESDFQLMKNMYLSSNFAAEKQKYLSALAYTRTPSLIQQTLDLSISNDVKSQDTVGVIAAVASTESGRSLAWEFTKKHWVLLNRRYGAGGFALTRLVKSAGYFYTQTKLDEVSQFYSTHPVPAAARAVSQIKESIAGSLVWVQNHALEVCDLVAQ